MTPVKIVLSRAIEGSDPVELELGPFNQGVVFENGEPMTMFGSMIEIKDVASSGTIAYNEGGPWFVVGDTRNFERVYVQPVPEPEPARGPGIIDKPDPLFFKRFIRGIMTDRPFTVSLPRYLEDRLRAAGERADRQMGDDPLPRGEDGTLTDQALSYVALGTMERGIEADERDSGLVAHLDGSLHPIGES